MKKYREKEVKEVKNPLEEKMKAISDENLIAFRISQEGYDSVYNIGEHWTYDMVQECFDHIELTRNISARQEQELEYREQ